MAEWGGKLVSMELDDSDKYDATPIAAQKPDFPYGLRICLTEKELEKLGLDSDCEVGDYLDMRAFATVTSVSKNDTGDGQSCRVELQIEKLSIESETDE